MSKRLQQRYNKFKKSFIKNLINNIKTTEEYADAAFLSIRTKFEPLQKCNYQSYAGKHFAEMHALHYRLSKLNDARARFVDLFNLCISLYASKTQTLPAINFKQGD